MRVLYLIPARRGSRGVCGKNTRQLNGKPMIAYSIECALGLSGKEDICISTDDPLVVEIAAGFGLDVPFVRPDILCTDEASQISVVKHALRHYTENGVQYDALVLLQPTSPLRRKFHVEEALKLFDSSIDMVVAVKRTSANPYFVLYEDDNEGMLRKVINSSFNRRQDCPDVWELNGACYVINTRSLYEYNSFSDFRRLKKYVMEERFSVDVDTIDDFEIAEFYLRKYNE
jgi:CMP-N,N'-diacetyllegionaminic acid synthase